MNETQANWIPFLKRERRVIYCIWNRVNNRRYIGKTVKTFWLRYSRGKWWENSSNQELKDDYHIYGPDAFLVYLLEQDISIDDLPLVEGLYIQQLQTMHPKGYNLVYTERDNMKIRKTEKAIQNCLDGKRKAANKIEAQGVKKLPRRMPIEFCEEHALRMAGRNNPMYGKQHTASTKEKIRQKAIGRQASSATRLKMSLRRGALHPRSKQVEQIDVATGLVVKIYGSAREAARNMNVTAACIVETCLGNQNTSKGFKWKYHEIT